MVPAMVLRLPIGPEATELGDDGQKPPPPRYFDDSDEKLLNSLWKMPLIGQEAVRIGFDGNEQTVQSSKSRPDIYETLVKEDGWVFEREKDERLRVKARGEGALSSGKS